MTRVAEDEPCSCRALQYAAETSFNNGSLPAAFPSTDDDHDDTVIASRAQFTPTGQAPLAQRSLAAVPGYGGSCGDHLVLLLSCALLPLSPGALR